ncbi:MAG: hypothetical protein NT141_01300 [candidate division WWE3 bacterium]|nr:hypothetical protein [candidate division WWE3 bacterium]
MLNLTNLLTTGPIVLFGLGLLLLNIFFALQLYRREKILVTKEKKMTKHIARVFDEATRKSEGLVERAAEKSADILSETEAVSSYIKDEITVALEETLKKDEHSVAKFLSRLESENVQYFKEVRGRISAQSTAAMEHAADETARELSQFVSELRSKTVAKHTDLEDSLQASFKAALTDIEAFKKDKIAALETSLPDLMQKVAGDYLGKTLTAADHEKLILRSLEEAKKEGLFN